MGLRTMTDPNEALAREAFERAITANGISYSFAWDSRIEMYQSALTRAAFIGYLAAWSARPQSDGEEALTIADYEECLADHRRLVRELDVALNGESGAAKQASLCDIVGQVTCGKWHLVKSGARPQSEVGDVEDAARFRWLVENHSFRSEWLDGEKAGKFTQNIEWQSQTYEDESGEDIRALIDAARAEVQP
jgi:hypothetical protein